MTGPTTAAALLARVGRNTGNMLFGDALRRQLAPHTLVRLADLQHGEDSPLSLAALAARHLERDFDVIVIGASNFLHAGADFTPWADFVAAVPLPVVLIGLGAQAPDPQQAVAVPAGTARLVRLAADRSATVGVRGPFTASVVRGLGVDNVRVIGCPAMFWSCRPSLTVTRRAARTPLSVVLNGSANVVEHAASPRAARQAEHAVARTAFAGGHAYVLQNEAELIDLVAGMPGSDDRDRVAALMAQYGLADREPEAFVAFARRQLRVHTSVQAWHAAMAGHDLVLGSRFHGTLIGVLAGSPGLFLVHDARTHELCELLAAPRLDVRELDCRDGILDLRALLDTLDVEPMLAAYPARYRAYAEFLTENGLAHALAS